jgi:hypothetical protein
MQHLPRGDLARLQTADRLGSTEEGNRLSVLFAFSIAAADKDRFGMALPIDSRVASSDRGVGAAFRGLDRLHEPAYRAHELPAIAKIACAL